MSNKSCWMECVMVPLCFGSREGEYPASSPRDNGRSSPSLFIWCFRPENAQAFVDIGRNPQNSQKGTCVPCRCPDQRPRAFGCDGAARAESWRYRSRGSPNASQSNCASRIISMIASLRPRNLPVPMVPGVHPLRMDGPGTRRPPWSHPPGSPIAAEAAGKPRHLRAAFGFGLAIHRGVRHWVSAGRMRVEGDDGDADDLTPPPVAPSRGTPNARPVGKPREEHP